MAADHHNHDVPAMDYAEHEKTFSLFANMFKWGTVGCVALMLFIGAVTGLVPWLFALIASVATAGLASKFL